MKNIETLEFLQDREACDEGYNYASKFPTMHECYEALLRGEAGPDSFDWALWVLCEDSVCADVDSLVLWLLQAVKPYLPKEMQRIDPASLMDPDGSSFEDIQNREIIRRCFCEKALKQGLPGPLQDVLPVLALCTWRDYITWNLDSAAIFAVRTLLLAYLMDHDALPAKDSPADKYIRGPYYEGGCVFPAEFQEMLLSRLREIPNPFEKEME